MRDCVGGLVLRSNQASLLRKYTHRFLNSAELDGAIRHSATGDQNDVVPLIQRRVEMSNCLAHPSFNLVPVGCVTNPSADSKAVSVVLQSIWLQHENQIRRRPGAPALSYPLKCPRITQSQAPCNHGCSGYLRPVGLYSVETDNDLRPRRRRAVITARPPRVFIRARKPCVRFLGIRFG
jgi:hypothetical protein